MTGALVWRQELAEVVRGQVAAQPHLVAVVGALVIELTVSTGAEGWRQPKKRSDAGSDPGRFHSELRPRRGRWPGQK
jgi:hypothetical protein